MMRSLLPSLSFSCLLVAAPLHAAIEYTITDLGFGAGDAVNDAGVVVGVDNTATAFVYQNGAKTLIKPTNNSTRAWGINASGVVTGTINGSNNGFNAFSWQNGVTTQLPFGNANDINDLGMIVGQNAGGLGYYSNGAFTNVPGSLGSTIRIGLAINNLVDIVGRARDSQGSDHAALWSNGAITALSATNSQAEDINNLRQIVGYDYAGTSATFAYRWDANGNAFRLGGVNSLAHAINDYGVIVGLGGLDGRACRWVDGQFQDLTYLVDPNAPWILDDAVDISNSGYILVKGRYIPNQASDHILLLSPIPEPASLALLSISLLPLLARTRRRL